MISKKTLTSTEGQQLVNEFHKSGIKPGKFCAEKNISYRIFKYWRDKYAVQNKVSESTVAKFLPINIKQAKSNTTPIKITINSKINIELPDEVNMLQLKKILEICIACG